MSHLRGALQPVEDPNYDALKRFFQASTSNLRPTTTRVLTSDQINALDTYKALTAFAHVPPAWVFDELTKVQQELIEDIQLGRYGRDVEPPKTEADTLQLIASNVLEQIELAYAMFGEHAQQYTGMYQQCSKSLQVLSKTVQKNLQNFIALSLRPKAIARTQQRQESLFGPLGKAFVNYFEIYNKYAKAEELPEDAEHVLPIITRFEQLLKQEVPPSERNLVLRGLALEMNVWKDDNSALQRDGLKAVGLLAAHLEKIVHGDIPSGSPANNTELKAVRQKALETLPQAKKQMEELILAFRPAKGDRKRLVQALVSDAQATEEEKWRDGKVDGFLERAKKAVKGIGTGRKELRI